MQTCSKWENPINGNRDVSSFTKNPPKEQNFVEQIYDVIFQQMMMETDRAQFMNLIIKNMKEKKSKKKSAIKFNEWVESPKMTMVRMIYADNL